MNRKTFAAFPLHAAHLYKVNDKLFPGLRFSLLNAELLTIWKKRFLPRSKMDGAPASDHQRQIPMSNGMFSANQPLAFSAATRAWSLSSSRGFDPTTPAGSGAKPGRNSRQRFSDDGEAGFNLVRNDPRKLALRSASEDSAWRFVPLIVIAIYWNRRRTGSGVV